MAGKHVVSDPVSTFDGALIGQEIEFSCDGPVPLVLSRYYGSNLGLNTPLGRNWLSTLDVFIRRGKKRTLVYIDETGTEHEFERPTPGPGLWRYVESDGRLSFGAGTNRSLILRFEGLHTRFVKLPSGVWRIGRVYDLNGKEAHFSYDAQERLISVALPTGLQLVCGYEGVSPLRRQIDLVAPNGERRRIVGYAYDGQGNLTLADAHYGKLLAYKYDEQNRRTEWNDGIGWGRHSYDADGRVAELATSGPYNGDAFSYDSEARTTHYRPGGSEEAAIDYTFDGEGRLLRQEGPSGVETREYDALGNLSAVIDGEGNRTEYGYDRNGRENRVVDGEGRESLYFRDDDGRLKMVFDHLGNCHEWRYDEKGNLASMIGPDQVRLDISNDERGRPIGLMRHDGLIERRGYDESGRLAVRIDYAGEQWRYGRDAFGRLTGIAAPDGMVTKLVYEDLPGFGFWSPSQIVRPDGVVVKRTYERGKNRMIVCDGEGRETEYNYDSFDLLRKMSDPKGGVLQFTYDGQERLSGVTNQQGLRWMFERDAAGRVIREQDFGGLVLEYAYDKADRVIETRHMDGSRLAFTYDKSDLLICEEIYGGDGTLTDTTKYTYDQRGLLRRAENRSAVVAFRRDKLGRVVSETLNGREVKSGYDCCGNRVRREIGGRLVETLYDPLGAVKSLTVGSHDALAFKRDALGRELNRESSAGFRLESGYDAVGQLLKQVAGFSLLSLGGGGEGARRAQELGIDPQKATRQVERGYSWTKAFEPLSIADGRWGKTAYSYDANGQIERAAFGDGYAERFSYDAALNIAGFGEGPGPERKTLVGGAAGRGHVPPVDRGRFETWESAAGGRVSEAKGPNGERVYLGYDLRGRVTERRVERNGFRSRTWRYEWDAKDRLIACTTPERERWVYGYDPFGRRIHKINATKAQLAAKAAGIILPGDEQLGAFHEARPLPKDAGKQARIGTAYQWDGHSLAEEAPLMLDGTVLWDEATRWHYEPDSFRPIAKEEPDGKLLYIVTDHLGTPREMFSEDGKLQWAAEYRTWGMIRKLWRVDPDNDNLPMRENAGPRGVDQLIGSKIPHSSSLSGETYGNLALRDDPVWQEATLQCPIRFQGQREDSETGLYYNRFRYYDPLSGQYISPDPLGFEGGGRKQGYVTNPITWIDPLGLKERGLWDPTTEAPSVLMGPFGKMYEDKSVPGQFWSKDIDEHGHSIWKVHRETGKGYEWYRDADEYGDFIVGKHKGNRGKFISKKEVRRCC